MSLLTKIGDVLFKVVTLTAEIKDLNRRLEITGDELRDTQTRLSRAEASLDLLSRILVHQMPTAPSVQAAQTLLPSPPPASPPKAGSDGEGESS